SGAAAFIAVQVLSALVAAHEAGIVHRDVKPANIFLTRTAATHDFVKLVDFGVAWTLGPSSVRGHASAGTPAYMAPEQITSEGLGARTDIWAMGLCLYEMVSGQRAFDAPNDVLLLTRICEASPRPLHEVAPWAGDALDRIVGRSLKRRPAERYSS